MRSRGSREKPQPVKSKRITANLPHVLLEKAQASTGLSITETLVAGLELLLQKEAAKSARELRGKILVKEDGGRADGDRRR